MVNVDLKKIDNIIEVHMNRYEKNLVDKIRSIDEAKYHHETRHWTFPCRFRKGLLQYLRDNDNYTLKKYNF